MKEGRKEGNVLFNVLNTFYLRLYSVRQLNSERGNMGYSIRLAARVLLYAPSTDRIAHITAFAIPVVEHWLEREIAQCVCLS